MEFLGEHDNARVRHTQSLNALRSHTIELRYILVDSKRGENIPVELVEGFLQHI
jgi:hypothetical protein